MGHRFDRGGVRWRWSSRGLVAGGERQLAALADGDEPVGPGAVRLALLR